MTNEGLSVLPSAIIGSVSIHFKGKAYFFKFGMTDWEGFQRCTCGTYYCHSVFLPPVQCRDAPLTPMSMSFFPASAHIRLAQ